MRDIALSLVVAALLVLTLKHPVVGAYLWAWLSLMNPHKLTYGFANNLPFAYVAAVVAVVSLAMTKKRQMVPFTGITVTLLVMLFWMTITSFFAIAPVEQVQERWIFVMKIQFMLFVTLMLVLESKQLRVLIWIVTFSVAFFGVKGGIWTVATGGGGRVWGPPAGMLEGNNELAVGLVILMPMMYYLWATDKHRYIRWALLFSMASCTFAILGTQSRGALVAMVSMLFFLGLKGRYPVRTSMLLVVFSAIAIAFMPDTWTNRMDTIRSFQEDDSAMSRIWTWTTLWNAAVDRPLIGAGFQADNVTVFKMYAPTDGEFAIFQGRVYVAHSIYFQMLGEHGFIGLGLFLLLGLVTWFTAGALAKQTKNDEELGSWMPMLMRMVQVSLIGYASGGLFLSLAYLDLPYYMLGFVVLSGAIAKRRFAQVKQATVNAKLGVQPNGATAVIAAASGGTPATGPDTASRLSRPDRKSVV
jgi:probable O-glycosylation ligase (exosortase A-associated)